MNVHTWTICVLQCRIYMSALQYFTEPPCIFDRPTWRITLRSLACLWSVCTNTAGLLACMLSSVCALVGGPIVCATVVQQQPSQDLYACTRAGDQVSICEKVSSIISFALLMASHSPLIGYSQLNKKSSDVSHACQQRCLEMKPCAWPGVRAKSCMRRPVLRRWLAPTSRKPTNALGNLPPWLSPVFCREAALCVALHVDIINTN